MFVYGLVVSVVQACGLGEAREKDEKERADMRVWLRHPDVQRVSHMIELDRRKVFRASREGVPNLVGLIDRASCMMHLLYPMPLNQ